MNIRAKFELRAKSVGGPTYIVSFEQCVFWGAHFIAPSLDINVLPIFCTAHLSGENSLVIL